VVGSIFLMLALLASSAWVALCLFWVSGLGFSIVYPCVMSLAGHVFPHDQSRVVAWISASGGLGVWLFPLLMSMISQHWDIQAGFWFYTSLSFLMLVAVFAAGRLPIQVPEES
jgi:fucose permease